MQASYLVRSLYTMFRYWILENIIKQSFFKKVLLTSILLFFSCNIYAQSIVSEVSWNVYGTN